ncbi:MAG TPA: FxLYD domain-containing protein [Jiangellaceae bacterium]|nr:FxLYD domain-containing protein [Jiangellaceae bacterium]
MAVPSPITRKPSFWSTTAGSLTIAGIVIAILLAAAAVYVIGARAGTAKAGDVRITDCGVSGYTAVVEYIVVNSSGSTQDYRITFEIKDSDGTRVGTGSDSVTGVAPEQAVRGEQNISITSARSPSCVVADVS